MTFDPALVPTAKKFLLTLDQSQITTNLSDFPLTIRIGASVGTNSFNNTAIFTELGSNKLRLSVDVAGTQCPVEIEYWDAANLKAILHTKIPTYSGTSDTIVTLSFDNSQSDNSGYVGVIGSTPGKSVWSGEKLVIHPQDPTGTVLESATGYTLTVNGSMTSGDLVAGPIGKAIDYDGGDDCLYHAHDAAWDISVQTLTIFCQFNRHDSGWNDLIGFSSSTTSNYDLVFNTSGIVYFQWDNGGWQSYTASNFSSLDTWYSLSLTYDTGIAQFGCNGVLAGTSPSKPALQTNSGNTLNIGKYVFGSGGFAYVTIARLIVSPVKRSADWLKTLHLVSNDSVIHWSVIIEYYVLQKILIQPYTCNGSVRSLCNQIYNMMIKFVSTCDQIYGFKMLQILYQYYGDVPQIKSILDQWYGPASILQRLLIQKSGNATQLRKILDMEWNMPEFFQQTLEMRYSISSGQVQALADLVYNISEYNLIKNTLDQVYVLSPGDSLMIRPNITVSIKDGIDLDPFHLNIEIDENEFAIKGEIHLPEDQYLQCRHIETEILVTIDADTYELLVEAPRISRPEGGSSTYIVPLCSRSVLLDAPYADPLTREFSGAMASAIVADLANIEGINTDWQMVNWYIPGTTFYANAETPLTVIHKIVSAGGGILQPAPDGTLICRPEYPTTTSAYGASAIDYYLTDMDNFYSVDSTPEIRDAYNLFSVSDQDTGKTGLTVESIDIGSSKKEIHVFQVPFNAASFIGLETSGGPWVGIIDESIVTEQLTEQVEIVAGEGNTAKPIYVLDNHIYKQVILGALTISEDGHIKTEISGNSLIDVTYTTKYRKFIVSDAHIEDVQFYPAEWEI